MPRLAQPVRTPTVLIVEDDADLAAILKELIEGLGYGAICASNGQEALERMKESLPSLLLIDLFMPVMGGIEFLHVLRESELRAIPKLVMTAANDQMVGVKEDVSVLFKPLDLNEVADAVQKYCGMPSVTVP